MDLKAYYQKIRNIEAEIATPCAVIISLETADGGKAGQPKEVSRRLAARLVAEGKARLATQEEAAEYYAAERQLIVEAEQKATQSKLQIALVSEDHIRALKTNVKFRKLRDEE